jgi:hypothetical protein
MSSDVTSIERLAAVPFAWGTSIEASPATPVPKQFTYDGQNPPARCIRRDRGSAGSLEND